MEANRNRKVSTWLGIALGTVLALLATTAARAQNLTEEFHQTYTVSPDASLKLKNVNGFIKITAWDQNQIKVDAVKRAHSKTKLDEAKIVVENDANSVYIRTRYPEQDNWDTNCNHYDDCPNAMAIVDYTVLVPRNAKLTEINSVNGSVEVKGAHGPMKVAAVNGRVEVTGASSESEISSVNGVVEASFDRLTGASRVHAVNGRVTVTLPSDSNVRITAESVNGTISNDLGLPESRGRFVGHNLDGKLGDGANALNASTVNGRIEVHHANDGKTLSAVTSLLPRERTIAPY